MKTDAPGLLLGISVAAVLGMMFVGQGPAKGAVTGPPPGPLEPPEGAGKPGSVVVPAGRRAIVTLGVVGAEFGPSDETVAKASIEATGGKVESVQITPSVMSLIVTWPKDRTYVVNTPTTVTQGTKAITTTTTVVLL